MTVIDVSVNDFGRHKLRVPNQRVAPGPFISESLRQTKVPNFDLHAITDHEVARIETTVDDSLAVHEFYRMEHLDGVVAHLDFVEVPPPTHYLFQAFSLAQFQDHVYIQLIFKKPVHFHDSSMLTQIELNLYLFNKPSLATKGRQVLFIHYFGSKLVFVGLFFKDEDSGEATLAQIGSLEKFPRQFQLSFAIVDILIDLGAHAQNSHLISLQVCLGARNRANFAKNQTFFGDV